jgi:hypothetical protein
MRSGNNGAHADKDRFGFVVDPLTRGIICCRKVIRGEGVDKEAKIPILWSRAVH